MKLLKIFISLILLFYAVNVISNDNKKSFDFNGFDFNSYIGKQIKTLLNDIPFKKHTYFKVRDYIYGDFDLIITYSDKIEINIKLAKPYKYIKTSFKEMKYINSFNNIIKEKIKDIEIVYRNHTYSPDEEKKLLDTRKWFKVNLNENHSIKELKGMKYFFLPDNSINKDLRHASILYNLNFIYLGYNKSITNKSLHYIKNLQYLRLLRFSNTGISDKGMDQITKHHSLRSLILENINLTDNGLVHLNRLKYLKHINLSGTKISNKGLVYLQNNKYLKSLNLNNTQITDDGLVHLRTLKRLNVLRLKNTEITGTGLVYLRELPINKLIIENTKINDNTLKYLVGSRIGYLFLNNNNISNNGLMTLIPLKSYDIYLVGTKVTKEGIKRYKSMGGKANIYID